LQERRQRHHRGGNQQHDAHRTLRQEIERGGVDVRAYDAERRHPYDSARYAPKAEQQDHTLAHRALTYVDPRADEFRGDAVHEIGADRDDRIHVHEQNE
jgi:hypothetical protein